MEEINYLMIMSTCPEDLLVPKDWYINLCDTTLFPHHQPVRALCMSWSETLWPSPLLGFLKGFAEILW